MSPLVLSPLELAVLHRMHELYGDRGFPPPEQISVQSRENTGAGRYVDLETAANVEVADTQLDLDGAYIEMQGVPWGMMAIVWVKSHRIQQLEIVVYGNTSWDGEERAWSIVVPK